MHKLSKYRQSVSKLIDAMTFMSCGALLLAWYAEHYLAALAQEWRSVQSFILYSFWCLCLIGNFLRPQSAENPQTTSDPSPRWSGIWVVMATGIAAIWAVHGKLGAKAALLTEIGIFLATALIAMAVWRFATRHAHQIGEARFSSND